LIVNQYSYLMMLEIAEKCCRIEEKLIHERYIVVLLRKINIHLFDEKQQDDIIQDYQY
jgi:hypothetical protein